MKIIIFGATGFIGTALTDHFIKKGYSITVVTRNGKNVKKLFHNTVKMYVLDDLNNNDLSDLISKNDVIINLAGENIASGVWTNKQKQRILQSRLRIGEIISNSIEKATTKPRLLIQASATGYYGYNTEEECNENSPKGLGFLADVSEKWEKSTEIVKKYGIRRIIIRTGVVLGRKGGMLPRLVKPARYFLGSIPGNGSNHISWIHLDDEIRAIDFLLHNENSKGIYNLVTPNPLPVKGLMKTIGKILKRPVWLIVPAGIVKLLPGKMAEELLLSNQLINPQKLITEGFKFKYEDIDIALKSLLE